MTQNAEASSKITNAERIARLITRMCESQMQALVRTKDNSKLGIRSAFQRIGVHQNHPAIFFNHMSDAGLSKLISGMHVKIEVLGMPSQVIFVTIVKEVLIDGMICLIPTSLISTERRHNARYKLTPSMMAYLNFSFWSPDVKDPGSPPFFNAYGKLAGWVSIADISVGGICLQSHFPAVFNAAETVKEDENTKLHLPMSAPILLHALIRWRRKIKNRFEEDGLERFQMDYRIGVEFQNVDEEKNQKIRQFIRQLSIADAI